MHNSAYVIRSLCISFSLVKSASDALGIRCYTLVQVYISYVAPGISYEYVTHTLDTRSMFV